MVIKNDKLGGTDNQNGEVIDANNVNDTNDAIIAAGAPIGAVQAWLKSETGTPPLPSRWVECNGQTISDAESPYDGQAIPDLNGSTGAQRFLRGALASGTVGGSETHTHVIDTANMYIYGNDTYGGAHDQDDNTTQAADSKPPFYEVVWIMRIK